MRVTFGAIVAIFTAVLLPTVGFSETSVICNFNSSRNTLNDLLTFVQPNSEYISATRGLFEHFQYNRLIRTQLTAQGYKACTSIVKVGARDFGNGNTYGDYFIEVAYSKTEAQKPDYILSALFKAGSVQSFEGTERRPWFMLNTLQVSSQLKYLAESATFEEVKNVTAFDPLAIAASAVLNTPHMIYDGQGVTYVPIYFSGKQEFLVTWGAYISQAKTYQGALVKIENQKFYISRLEDMTSQIYLGLSQNRDVSDPAFRGLTELDDASLCREVLKLSHSF